MSFMVPAPVTLTYRVRNPLRRWWLRRNGWSTEWTVEFEWENPVSPIRDLRSPFGASR